MKNRASKQSGMYNLPIILAVVLVAGALVFLLLFGFNSESQQTGRAIISAPGNAAVAPSLSGAVVAEKISAATTTSPPTCSEETEKSYVYDESGGSNSLQKTEYRIVKRCSDGSGTVIKDWTPLS